jgi:fluoride exporter
VEREPDIDAIDEGAAVGGDLVLPAVDVRELCAVFAGGVLGAIPRAALEESLRPSPGSWPWATFAVNLAACAVLGYAVAWLGEHHPRTMYVRAFVVTGVCGALSTFSAVMIELIRLYEHAGLWLAFAYAAASILAGACALLLGMAAAPRVRAPVPVPPGRRRR